MSYDALDDFAGPGGWDEGARMVGLTTVGIEWDHAACHTAAKAGHARIRADVAAYPSEPFQGIPGYIASPPCQAWSMAGARKGEMDRANCHVLADRMVQGDDSLDWTTWEDPRSALVCQPVRRVRELRPEWIAQDASEPGVYGGLTAEERRKPPVTREYCGRRSGARIHRRHGEHTCEACREAEARSARDSKRAKKEAA